ncbi:MAG: type II toxin-antitoxin system VapC family toxin [Methanomassiliicoccaceae archaeon]|nr:type II toxin-antitoxin system VapC family toxin [Methanomassiliicoccaceae archaeon]
MKYFLDTNVVIDMFNTEDQGLTDRIHHTPVADIKIPSLVKGELLHGVQNNPRSKKADDLKVLFSTYEVVPFDSDASEEYARIRYEMMSKGELIGPKDMIIAATVLSNGGVLVTNNVKEFSHVPGLRTENWRE